MRLLFLAALIALSSAVFAQSNYHQGYVIKNNGDTLKGFINYREWIQSPKSVEFKINERGSELMRFDPQNIKGFQITAMETYVTYAGPISNNKTRFPYLQDRLDTAKNAGNIFLRTVASGRYLTLFYYNDDLKPRYFIAETNQKPVELNYYVYYGYDNDQKRVVQADAYKAQLSMAAGKFNPDNIALAKKIQNTGYELQDLKSVIDIVNGIQAFHDAKGPTTRFFAGVTIGNTSTQYNTFFSSDGAWNSASTVSPKINLGMDLFNNWNVQKVVFRSELSLSYVNPKFQFPVGPLGQNVTGVYSFNQYTATLTPQILFNVYNKVNFKFFLDAGVGLNFSAYKTNEFTLNNQPAAASNAIAAYTPRPEPFWFSFPVQAGVTLNQKFELSLTYYGHATYTTNGNYDIRNSSAGLGVKYLFGPNGAK